MKLLFVKLSLLFLFFSCSSKKDILYIQDVQNELNFSSLFNEHVISVDDVLKIDISSESPEAAIGFNPRGLNTSYINNKDSFIFYGYQVDTDGNINFPLLGKIKVKGSKIGELRKNLVEMIVNRGFLINPTVDIKLMNLHFTIIGEVNKPGRYNYLENSLNIFEALGMAGDLTINGVRDDVVIIRSEEDIKTNKINSINLTNSDILKSEFFHIKSGDVIIVKPNNSRIKNAGIIGNSGTLLSLLSFILSSIIVISN